MTRRSTALLALLLPTALLAHPAEAKALYRNCAALNVDYPNGVGLPSALDKTKSAPVTAFTVDAVVYRSVKGSLDRDEDGIACEKQ